MYTEQWIKVGSWCSAAGGRLGNLHELVVGSDNIHAFVVGCQPILDFSDRFDLYRIEVSTVLHC